MERLSRCEDDVLAQNQALPFPWDDVLHFGLFVLRLPPSHLWAITPYELFIMMGGARFRPTRAVFDDLMQKFPDHPRQA